MWPKKSRGDLYFIKNKQLKGELGTDEASWQAAVRDCQVLCAYGRANTNCWGENAENRYNTGTHLLLALVV